MTLAQICYRIIKSSFYLLFFLTPLIMTPFNYELFEFNKMIFVYFLTIVILGAWLIKMVAERKIRIQRTPLDIPITIYLITQLLSTLFSIDLHVSLWGYYSRFHGGLLSTICYIILYYAFVTNFGEHLVKREKSSLAAGSPPLRREGLKIFVDRIRERAVEMMNSKEFHRGRVADHKNFLRPTSAAKRQATLALLPLDLHRLFLFILASATLVSSYGILEHFGIDKNLWVQDVQNRVFSTLGQPNWLAAYLCIVLPVSIAFALNSKCATLLSLIFYLCLLFTKSRSGFLGFWVTNFIFILFTTISFKFSSTIVQKKVKLNHSLQRQEIYRKLLILNLFFLIITFFIGSPFQIVHRYFSFSSLSQRLTKSAAPSPLPLPPSLALETGITGSSEIRKIVWKGAVDIARHFPLFGSGVETFAFSYYRFKPREHNLTSEWDFLYNKAHNEYLNYAATTGFLGLGCYLLVILTFVIWFLRSNSKFEALNSKQIPNSKFKIQNSFDRLDFGHLNLFGISDLGFRILNTALFTGWLSILITNFFGFSVVVAALFFFLIPAISFALLKALNPKNSFKISLPTMKQLNNLVIAFILLFTFYFLLFTLKLWYADTLFAKGNSFLETDDNNAAYLYLQKAVALCPHEPLYHEKLSLNLGNLATTAFLENESSLSADLVNQALFHSKMTVATSPQNVNFWKSRTRVFYTLSQIEEKYFPSAIESLLVAQDLAPTDAKILYNLALLYAEGEEPQKAIETLEKTVELKPNYRNARYGLALLYQKEGRIKEAVNELKYILEKIDPNDSQVKKELEEWGK